MCMRVVTLVAAMTLGLMGCALADPQPPAKPLPHTTLVVDTETGHATFDVEVASDWRSQEYGLMNRKSMPRNAGMIFDFKIPENVSFWMKDTLIPLDMLFIRADGTISSIAPDAVPMSEDSIRSSEPVRFVLEINGGEAAKLGIYPGNKVHGPLLGNVPKTH